MPTPYPRESLERASGASNMFDEIILENSLNRDVTSLALGIDISLKRCYSSDDLYLMTYI